MAAAAAVGGLVEPSAVSIPVFIRHAETNTRLDINVNRVTVAELKRLFVRRITGTGTDTGASGSGSAVVPRDMKLVFGGSILVDDRLISTYPLIKECVIQCITPLLQPAVKVIASTLPGAEAVVLSESLRLRLVKCPNPKCGFRFEPILSTAIAAGTSTDRLKQHFDSSRYLCIECGLDFCIECRTTPYHRLKSCPAGATASGDAECRFCRSRLITKHDDSSKHSSESNLDSKAPSIQSIHSVVCSRAECTAKLSQFCHRQPLKSGSSGGGGGGGCNHFCPGVINEAAVNCPKICYDSVCVTARQVSTVTVGSAGSESGRGSGRGSGSGVVSTPAISQASDDFCVICGVDELREHPIIELRCGHLFHLHCMRRRLGDKTAAPAASADAKQDSKSDESEWPWPVSVSYGYFRFTHCPLCAAWMGSDEEVAIQSITAAAVTKLTAGRGLHPALSDLFEPIVQILRTIHSHVVEIAAAENFAAHPKVTNAGSGAGGAVSPYYHNPILFGLDHCVFYWCSGCKKLQYGGQKSCEAAVATASAASDGDESTSAAAALNEPNLCPACMLSTQLSRNNTSTSTESAVSTVPDLPVSKADGGRPPLTRLHSVPILPSALPSVSVAIIHSTATAVGLHRISSLPNSRRQREDISRVTGTDSDVQIRPSLSRPSTRLSLPAESPAQITRPIPHTTTTTTTDVKTALDSKTTVTATVALVVPVTANDQKHSGQSSVLDVVSATAKREVVIPSLLCNISQHADAILWKCRFCCVEPSSFLCFGSTHFCSFCHTNDFVKRRTGGASQQMTRAKCSAAANFSKPNALIWASAVAAHATPTPAPPSGTQCPIRALPHQNGISAACELALACSICIRGADRVVPTTADSGGGASAAELTATLKYLQSVLTKMETKARGAAQGLWWCTQCSISCQPVTAYKCVCKCYKSMHEKPPSADD